MNYKEKYLKYKKKYLDTKKYKNINLNGGYLIDTSILDDHNTINDEFTLLDYHGEIATGTFIIPKNIILILSNCCGAPNSASVQIWQDPLLNDICNTKTFSKETLINNIKDNNSTIILGGNQQYIVLQPESEICNFNLTNHRYDFAIGTNLKKFDETIFYDIFKIFTNEVEVNKRIAIMKSGLMNYIDNGVVEKYRNIDMGCLYSCNELKYFLDLFMLHNDRLFEKVDTTTMLEFINYATYTNLMATIRQRPSAYKNIKIDITRKSPRNIDLLIYLFFEGFIKDNNFDGLSENFNLSDKLDKINKDLTKKTFVFLYACQDSSNGTCGINECYKRFRGTFNPSSNANIFLTNVIKSKIDNNKFKLSYGKDPIIRFIPRHLNELEYIKYRLNIKNSLDIEKYNISDNDLLIFINMFYDILINHGSTINKTIDNYKDKINTLWKEWKENKITTDIRIKKINIIENDRKKNNAKFNKNINNKCIQLGKLITSNCYVISIDLINKFYNKDTYILDIINDETLTSYFNTFKEHFNDFLKILFIPPYEKITLNSFYEDFTRKNNILYNKLLSFFSEIKSSFSFPIEINNEIQIRNIFKSLRFTSNDYKIKVCNYITDFKLDGLISFESSLGTITDQPLKSGLEKLINMLKQVDILIKYSNNKNHTIESYYNINDNNNIVNDEVKINYLLRLIKIYNCNTLIKESSIKIQPI